MNDIDKFFSNSAPSIIKNPFGMEHVEMISMWMIRNRLFGKDTISFSADITFKNGNTSGKQEITGDNFQDLFIKVYDFCSKL